MWLEEKETLNAKEVVLLKADWATKHEYELQLLMEDQLRFVLVGQTLRLLNKYM